MLLEHSLQEQTSYWLHISRLAMEASSSKLWIPKGLSSLFECRVYNELIRLAKERKLHDAQPRPIVVITDVGKDYSNVAALFVLKELHRLGLVELRAVVANLLPADKKARGFARAALPSLGVPHVPVACGTHAMEDHVQATRHGLEFIGDDFLAARDVPDLQDGQDLLLKVYENAKDKGEKVYLLCLSSLQDIVQFSASHPSLVAECTAEVHMMVGDELEQQPQLFTSNPNNSSVPSIEMFRKLPIHTYKKVDAFHPPYTSLESKLEVFWKHCCIRDKEIMNEAKAQFRVMASLLKGSLLDAASFISDTALCNFCDGIDFGVLGFHKPVRDEDSIGKPRARPIQEVLQNSKCIFCREVAESFSKWSRGKFDMHTLELQNDSNQACYEMVSLKEGANILVRLQVTLKVFSLEHVAYGLILLFQKCSRPLRTFSHDDHRQEQEQEQAYYNGRERPLVADTRLFRHWVDTCCNYEKHLHPHCGNSIYRGKDEEERLTSKGFDEPEERLTYMGLDGLRLVDVENMCVVDVDGDVSYTALSYVWGGYKFSTYQLTTVNRFREPGSLEEVMLPKTISDAIEVTKCLDLKYIWIDCLCIVQGDEFDERYFIPHMDVIFGCAAFTIVAASGDNADSGLPGIRPNTRNRTQVPFTIKGVSLVRTLDPERSEERHSTFDGYLKESVWCKRGWTFQEKLLSPRALIFTEEQVYWECQKSSWCEDGLWEISESSDIIYRHCFGDADYWLPWQNGFERRYRKVVEEYSGRMFKHEKDRRDAFEGILQRFQWDAKRRHVFLWALPKRFLSNALTWRCKEISPKRRQEKCRVTSEWGQPIKDCPFPSWSWLGWMGTVKYFNALRGKLDATTVDLGFYYFFGGKLLSVNQSGGTRSLTEMGVREDGDKTIVTLEDIPKSLDRVLVQEVDQSNILIFWSSTARLHVRHDGVDSKGNAKLILSHGAGNKRKDIDARLWFQKPSFPPGYAQIVDFVVIGFRLDKRLDPSEQIQDKRSLTKDESGIELCSECVQKKRKKEESEWDENLLAVLLVEWKNGVAYRQGLVHIQLTDWTGLDNQIWKLIFLG